MATIHEATGRAVSGGERLLIIEDELSISDPLSRALRRDSYEVDIAATGEAALLLLRERSFDAVLLDLGLPDVDGIELCRKVRAAHENVVIIMLTARGHEVDTVVGLDAGADDYISKPFRLAELTARLRAQLRRSPGKAGQPKRVRVDNDARRAWVGADELDLTAKEFDLLALLIGEEATVVSRDRLMREVWGRHWESSTKTLDIHVSNLRRKMGDDANAPRFISTVRGVGFRFEAND